MEQVGRFIAQEIFQRRCPETTEQQRRSTELEDSSSLIQRSSGIASCREIDFSQDDQLSDNMNVATSSSVPSITLEDCRDALKNYPNHDRLILKQDQKTGKISMLGASSRGIAFTSQQESQENRAALQSVKNLIIECAQSHGRPSVNYHPMLLYRIEAGVPLDSETLRRILFASTGTIHGIEGDYEYQAALADPTRNVIEDLPEGFNRQEISEAVQSGLAKVSTAITKMSDKVSSLRIQLEDENARYKDYALHPNERVSLLDPRTKKPTPGIKSSLQK